MVDQNLEALSLKIKKGATVRLDDVVAIVGPPAEIAEVPVKLPEVSKITPGQTEAIAHLPKVFGKVVPTTKRELTAKEIQKLYDERKTLDTIEKMAKTRKADIRTAVVNHFDSEGPQEPHGPIDKEGHFLVGNSVAIEDTDQAFTWEVREGTPTFSEGLLKELDEKGEIEHDLYLRLTDQVRVVSEDKVMKELANDPDGMLEIIRRASVAGTPVGTFNVRKRKV